MPTSYQTLVLISFTQGGRCRECAGIRRVSSCVSLKPALPVRFHVTHLWFTPYKLYLLSIWRRTVCTCAVCVIAWLPTVLANRWAHWKVAPTGAVWYYLSVRKVNVFLMLAHANTNVITIWFTLKFLRVCLHAKSTILVTRILSIPEIVKFLALYVDTSLFKERLTPWAEEYVKSPVPNECTIQNLMKSWSETGSVAGKQRIKQRPVRPT